MKLILTVGLPRSGKSTWAHQQSHPIVNPDSIRLALHGQAFLAPAEPFVWAIAYCMVRALFLAGHETVIVDATNVSWKRRKEWQDRFLEAEFCLQVFTTAPAACIQRALDGGCADLVPVIERMATEWDLPEALGSGERRELCVQQSSG